MSGSPRVLILGAGPTGLGAAWRLHERGHTHWKLVDAASGPGGLAASVVDEQGFTWDMGGHVLFSHYEYFDALMTTLLGDAWIEHERKAWVRMRDRFIPYPLQNNIRHLDAEELLRCLEGLLDRPALSEDGAGNHHPQQRTAGALIQNHGASRGRAAGRICFELC